MLSLERAGGSRRLLGPSSNRSPRKYLMDGYKIQNLYSAIGHVPAFLLESTECIVSV